ncbi:hypothetical protein GA0070613_4958 [Micromonospora inositola]|uniref:PD-(D/E)XK nuclease superfamily protein n=1 Tax=Micromonospora inositola TaxID=47865 RepID=A0A1C5JMJ7_9ACTN|nr:hypothetical protein GA0070613_4958 [Micromonospora inositola]
MLDHPDVATDADERLFEALLLYGLRCIPKLGDHLFSCGSDVDFRFGARGQADIVGWRGETVLVECEVKIRAQFNGQKDGVNQLDRYAANVPSDASLFLLTPETYYPTLALYEVHTWERWTPIWLTSLRTAVLATAGQSPAGDGSAERLARALARLF